MPAFVSEVRATQFLPALVEMSLRCPLISSSEVAERILSDENRTVLVDCRSLLAFTTVHIKGAIHVNCSSLARKRLTQGKTKLKDLISSPEGKERYISSSTHRFVVYDEVTDVDDLQKSTDKSAIYIILQTLSKEGKETSLLLGGLKEFCKNYGNLCENASSKICDVLTPPTPPISEHSEKSPRGPPASVILPFLFLGSEEGAADEQLVDRLGIKFILNMTEMCPNFFSHRKDIHYKQIKINDSYQEDIGQYFEEAVRFIDEARANGTRVLVHCHAGVSRSATVTVAYVMKHLGLSLNDAYKFVKERRPEISPNLNFMGQLLKYEKNKKNME